MGDIYIPPEGRRKISQQTKDELAEGLFRLAAERSEDFVVKVAYIGVKVCREDLESIIAVAVESLPAQAREWAFTQAFFYMYGISDIEEVAKQLKYDSTMPNIDAESIDFTSDDSTGNF